MANFIKILAASVGGGLVLGAGIRLGEAIAAREPGTQPGGNHKLTQRIGALESRLEGLEAGSAAVSTPRFDAHAAELSAVRSQIHKDNGQIEMLNETSTRLRGELQGWLEVNVATRMADVEARLKLETERSQKQMLDAFVDTVQTRVIQRISSLEEEVAGQSAAMSELRECSMRTEQSMQKLLGGLDRLIVKQPVEGSSPAAAAPDTTVTPETAAAAETAAAPESPAPAPPEPPRFAEPRRRSKWSIFG